MTVSRLDVANRAYARLASVSIGSTLPATDFAFADATLGALYLELSEITAMPFTLDAIPDEYLIPLGDLLAHDIGPGLEVMIPRGRALSRFMAIVRPDDREYPDPDPALYF